jgi:hypothetical protein
VTNTSIRLSQLNLSVYYDKRFQCPIYLIVTVSEAVLPAESVTVRTNEYPPAPELNCTRGVAVFPLLMDAVGPGVITAHWYINGLPSKLVDFVPSNWN